jgi:L-alanine-DL-glutamate epimerase-like enolase superfamily enzyme
MLANRPTKSDGGFALPQSGGFGWELDPAFIKKYRVDAG